jgi:TolB-like protein
MHTRGFIPLYFGVALVFSATASFSGAMSSAPASAKPLPSLAVNNLDAHGLTESEALTLSDVLRARLMETGKFKVMERGEMETILKEQAFQQSGACNEEACMVEMGQLLGIEQILAGSIGRVGKAFSISVRIISVQSGEIIRSISHSYTGPIENLLTSEITVVAKQIAGIQPVIESRPVEASAKKSGNKVRRRVMIGGVAGIAVAGGAAAFFLLKDTKSEPGATSNVEVKWTF